MPAPKPNKYRNALEILQRGRDRMVDDLAEQVLDQSDDLLESGFLFNEFLENQGTRLHFLSLLLAQLEQSAEQLDEQEGITPDMMPQVPGEFGSVPDDFDIPLNPPEPPKRKRKPRAKKLTEQASREGEPGET